jgi:hypothetical protein
MPSSKGSKKGKLEMLLERGPSSSRSKADDLMAEDGAEEEMGESPEMEASEDEGAEAAHGGQDLSQISDDDLLAELKKRGLGASDLEMGS